MQIKPNSILKIVLSLLAASTLCALGCNSEPSAKEDVPETSTEAGKKSASDTASNSQPATQEWNRRRTKEFEDTADDKFGTLAEGIGIAVGQPAPSASVMDADGKTVELSSLWQDGSVLVVFYRGGWCPYCNSQMRDLTEAAPEFAKRGVTPVAISVDTIDESSKTTKTYDIPFPILSDPDLAAHKVWKVTTQVEDAEFERLKGHGIDIEKASGKNHRTIAIPSMFLVDKTGTVLWAHADPGYKVRPRAKHILKALDADPTLTQQ